MLVSMGECLDVEMCLGPGERILTLDTPYGFEVLAIDRSKILVEIPLEYLVPEDQGKLRSYLFTQEGTPDSLVLHSSSKTVILRKEK